MTRPLIALAGFALVLFAALPVAEAQINPFLGSREVRLNRNDLDVMSEVASGLLRGEHIPDGTSVAWKNGADGRSGTITLLKTFTQNDMACKTLRYRVPVTSAAKFRNYDLNWCKIPDGEWKVVS